jgi:uncharacterized spore protein YtfJ
MNVSEPLKSIGDQIQSAGARKVYGDPVTVGVRTVIPVARVRYGFGGGGGGHRGDAQTAEQGGGGGGGGQISAVGVIEITPAGTRFIPIWDGRIVLVLIGFCLGVFAGRRWAR